MRAKSLLASIAASAVVTLAMPSLFTLAIMFPHWREISVYDLQMSYLIFGPFILIGAFGVAAPSYMLQRNDRSIWRKASVSALVCAGAAIVMLFPFADRIPWEGSAFGVVTFLVWLGAYELIQLSRPGSSAVRSEPSG